MSKYIINGGNRLVGKVEVPSAKNAVLPILAACILTDEQVVIHKCPKLRDVDNMLKILQGLGCVVAREGSDVIINSSNVSQGVVSHDLAQELRSSIFLLGSILARLGRADMAYPGGCEIGLRPIDIHLDGLKAMNIDVTEDGGHIYCDASNMVASELILDLPSVGATENLMMASVFTVGRTVISNVAREPEIVDLQDFLNSMGAKIRGAGSGVIVVEGVKSLHGIEYTPMSDRIAAGSYIISTVMCGGDVEFSNIIPEHLRSLVSKLSKTACNITVKNGIMKVRSNGRHPRLPKIDTMYYPGFPTDLQSQMTALATICDGTSIITENIFETRFKQVSEFRKMGAKIEVKGRTAIIEGVSRLSGAEVTAEDLRGGASLVSMGLFADRTTIVSDIYHIERGYEGMDVVYASLGANIVRAD